jgi:nitrogen-specific signal transduction histidine kinase
MSEPFRRVAHDLNNVFAAILGCADLLAIRLKDSPLQEDAKEIQRAAERGAALTRRLAAMGRKPGTRRVKGRTRRRKKKRRP